MKNVLVYILLLVFPLSVAGCANDDFRRSPTPSIIYIGPSDSLLMHPCKATPPGESLLDLARGYNKNVSCIGLYKLQINKIMENKKKQEALYNVK